MLSLHHRVGKRLWTIAKTEAPTELSVIYNKVEALIEVLILCSWSSGKWFVIEHSGKWNELIGTSRSHTP